MTMFSGACERPRNDVFVPLRSLREPRIGIHNASRVCGTLESLELYHPVRRPTEQSSGSPQLGDARAYILRP